MASNAPQARPELIAELGPLASRGWLSEQPPEFQAWALRSGRWRFYEPGQVIYDAGEPPDGLYGLAEGAMEVTFPLIAEEPVVLYRAEPGWWIGDSAVFAESPRVLSLSAATRCRVFWIPMAAARDLVERNPRYWRSFYLMSHGNAILALTVLAEALALSPKARLARTLRRMMDEEGRAHVSQIDLARLIGMTRSTLQRCLAELTECGAIATGYRSLRVVDPEALEQAARDL